MLRFLTASAVLLACPAWAGQCGPRQGVESVLRSEYGEIRQSTLITDSGTVRYFVDSHDGSWTFTLTRAGVSCIIAARGDDGGRAG